MMAAFVRILHDTTATQAVISGLKYGASYEWRVDAANALGTVQGDVWGFAIKSIAPPLQNASPIRRRLVAAAQNAIWFEDI